ncbi:MAG: NUDIX hydrolase [Pseudomonadota bacterium]
MRRLKLRTARCLIYRNPGDGAREYLLAVHATFRFRRIKRWGLIGGGIEWREDANQAALREVREELGIELPTAREVGDFEYKRALHRVVAAEWRGGTPSFDRHELDAVDWFNLAQVESLAADARLHASYELRAIQQFEQLTGPGRIIRAS